MADRNRNALKTNHLIADISYSKDYLECVCGWSGTIDDFTEHKKTSDPLPRAIAVNAWKLYHSKKRIQGFTNFKEVESLLKK